LRRLTRGHSGPRLVVLLLLFVGACKRDPHDPSALAHEGDAPLLSVLNVNDPAGAAQLVRGFYFLESGVWRWTRAHFEVALKPPPGASEKGGRLDFRFTLPDAVFKQLGPVKVAATINGLALAGETYTASGEYVYTRDVPADALKEDPVIVEFASDKAIPPSADDSRELALIAVSFGLEPK